MAKINPPRNHTSPPARLLEMDLEPLSEQRWSKIEHSVFARLDAGELPPTRSSTRLAPSPARRAGLWALGLAAGLCAVVSVLRGPLQGEAASISRISTGVTASHVALPGVLLDVSPESAVVVSGSADESALIVVDRGEVTCDVAHRRPGAPLMVQAGEVSVEVVGTRFTVVRHGDAASVSVQEGVVKVRARGRTALVKAGEHWASHEPAPANAAPFADPLSPGGPPEAASPANTARIPPEREAAAKALRETTKKRPGVRPISRNAEPSTSSLQTQFEAATQLEAKDPAEAIRLYGALEGGSGGWAANALFARGRLEAARGNRATARRVLTEYLARYPSGTNAPDARLLLDRLE